jgi:hypothetical protein
VSAAGGIAAVRANLNALVYRGRRRWNLLEFLPEGTRRRVPEAFRPFYERVFEDSLVLDNAYVTVRTDRWRVTLGRQQLSFGTGYLWNPVDLFNVKDLLDPTYEQPGHDALRIDLALGKGYRLTAVATPEDPVDDATVLFALARRRGGVSGRLYFARMRWELLEEFPRLPSRLRRLVSGVEVSGEAFGVGFWGEGTWNRLEGGRTFGEVLVGGDYTTEGGWSAQVEFLWEGFAPRRREDYRTADWMRYFAGQVKSLARTSLAVHLSWPVREVWEFTLSSISSPNDGSITLLPTLRGSLSDELELFAVASVGLGAEGGAYGPSLGQGLLLRLRYTF